MQLEEAVTPATAQDFVSPEALLGSVSGRFRGEGGVVEDQDRLLVLLRRERQILRGEIVGGAFLVEDVPAGSYILLVVAGTLPVLQGRAVVVEAGETVDVGLLVTEMPGSLVVHMTVSPEVRRSLERIDMLAMATERQAAHRLTLEGTEFRCQQMPPGDYVVMAAEGDVVVLADPFVIRSGEETYVRAELVAGVPQVFELRVAKGAEGVELKRVSVYSVEGVRVLQWMTSIALTGVSLPLPIPIPQGRWAVEFESSTGFIKRHEITVDALESEAEREAIVIEMQ